MTLWWRMDNVTTEDVFAAGRTLTRIRSGVMVDGVGLLGRADDGLPRPIELFV